MRLATVEVDGGWRVAVVDGARHLPLPIDDPSFGSMRSIAASGGDALARARAFAGAADATAWLPLGSAAFGPPVPDPGAIYTVAANYDGADERAAARPDRPKILGKLPSSVVGHGRRVAWDRSLTANVDAECELGVVIGAPAAGVEPPDAMAHVFGYTVVNDMNSVDPWFDGDQWLLGKSMAGFCPLGPWIVSADELDPTDLALGCSINGDSIQDGRTSQMRFPIAEVISYISRHVELLPGDIIATGTPSRSLTKRDRHLLERDVVTVWIEGIGELTNTIA